MSEAKLKHKFWRFHLSTAIVASLLVASQPTVFAAGADHPDPVVGKWTVKDIDANGWLKAILKDIPETAAKMSDKEKEDLKAQYLLSEKSVVYEFSADGKFNMTTINVKASLEFAAAMVVLGGLTAEKTNVAKAMEREIKEKGNRWVFRSGTWKKTDDAYEIDAKPEGVEFTFKYKGTLREGKLALKQEGGGTFVLTPQSNEAGQSHALLNSTELPHNGGVKSVVVSPDGKAAISAGFRDHSLRQWDLATGKQLSCLTGHDNKIFCLAISPDGSKAVSGDWNGQIRLWELKTGASSVLVNKNDDWTECIAFDPDGDHVALGSVQGELAIRECKTGNCVQQFYGHESAIKSVVYSSDGKQLLSGGLDATIRLWDVKTGKMVKTIKSKSGDVYFVAFMPDAHKAVYRADRVHLIDLESGEEERCFGDADTTAAFSESALSPDGKLIAAVQSDHSIRVWETATGAEKYHLPRSSSHSGPLTSLAISLDCGYLLSADLNGDAAVCVWKLTDK